MPSSYYENIPAIMKVIEEVNPNSVLDVGPGWGKYGFLIREYLDNFMKPNRRIDAVEIYRDYRTDEISKAYDRVWYDDFRKASFPAEYPYDLVLLIDVIEHFDKEDGWKVIGKALDIGKHVIVATPHGMMIQGERHGNTAETHLSGWHESELPGKDYSTHRSIIKLLGGDPDEDDTKKTTGA